MLPASVRILVCTTPQDLRRSFDGLGAVAAQLGEDPQRGAMLVFVNKRRNRVKVLWWERNGLCLLYKRLHRALFELPKAEGATTVRIDGRALAALLAGVSRETASPSPHVHAVDERSPA
jgi:transposase